MLKILNAILFVLIPVMQKLVKYHSKLIDDKQLKQFLQTEGEVDITKNKSFLNIMLYDNDIIKARREECAKCPHLVKVTENSMGNCGLCKCFIRAATRVARKSCPDGRWDAVDTSKLKVNNGINATS